MVGIGQLGGWHRSAQWLTPHRYCQGLSNCFFLGPWFHHSSFTNVSEVVSTQSDSGTAEHMVRSWNPRLHQEGVSDIAKEFLV